MIFEKVSYLIYLGINRRREWKAKLSFNNSRIYKWYFSINKGNYILPKRTQIRNRLYKLIIRPIIVL